MLFPFNPILVMDGPKAYLNPTALRKTKTLCNIMAGLLSKCHMTRFPGPLASSFETKGFFKKLFLVK